MRELVQRMNEHIQAMKEEVFQQRAVNERVATCSSRGGLEKPDVVGGTERNGVEVGET